MYYFEKDKTVHKIIHSIKYKKRFQTGIYFGKKFGCIHFDSLTAEKIDYIIPVPLHPLKKAERGYNQSEYISKGISKSSGIKLNCNIVKRIRYTRSQTMLTIEERKKNMKGAFEVKTKMKKIIDGKNILLFDDVITTGATIAECAKELKNAGANKVVAASLSLVA